MTINQFDAQFYLEQNPDVRTAIEAAAFLPVAGGTPADQAQAHFDRFGANEGRNPNAHFDEAFYLSENPDVAAAIGNGVIESGFAHFQSFGLRESRLPSEAFAEFDEQSYLNANADVAGAVSNGVFPSGLQHFLSFGFEEGRAGSGLSATSATDSTPNVAIDVRLMNDPVFDGSEQTIIDTTIEAVELWLDFFDLSHLENDIELQIDVEALDFASNALARGGSSFFSTDALPGGGIPSVLANKLMTGEDSNGDGGDAFIQLPQDADLLGRLTFGPVGERDTSALDVLTHEIGHGLGFSTLESSAWMQFVEQVDDQFFFTGANATIANGGNPVLLADPGHLSDELFPNAIMSATSTRGGVEEITPVEVAILRDMGLPVDDAFGFIA